jgi:hypothetical protein
MIPAFQRSIVQSELRNRHTSWQSPATKNKFFGSFITNPIFEEFGIERNGNGYFYLSDNLFVYNDLKNGNIFRIKKGADPKSWDCYSELYQVSQKLQSFRIDQPLYRENIRIGDETWEYAELQSPGKDYGQNYNDDVFQWPELTDGMLQQNEITPDFKKSVEDYFKEFVDQSADIVREAVAIATKHNCGLPINLCRPSTRFKDSQGYFWSDFDQDEWTASSAELYSFSMTIFGGTLEFANRCGVLDQEQIAECVTYAGEKWKIY